MLEPPPPPPVHKATQVSEATIQLVSLKNLPKPKLKLRPRLKPKPKPRLKPTYEAAA
jgi:hypothetical protein